MVQYFVVSEGGPGWAELVSHGAGGWNQCKGPAFWGSWGFHLCLSSYTQRSFAVNSRVGGCWSIPKWQTHWIQPPPLPHCTGVGKHVLFFDFAYHQRSDWFTQFPRQVRSLFSGTWTTSTQWHMGSIWECIKRKWQELACIAEGRNHIFASHSKKNLSWIWSWAVPTPRSSTTNSRVHFQSHPRRQAY